MKNLTLLLVTILLLTSCVSQRKCQNKFPPQIKETVKDSIVVKTVRDSIWEFVTVYDTIYADTVFNTITITGEPDNDFSFLENEFSQSTAKVLYGQLFHNLTTKAQIRTIETSQWIDIIKTYEEYYRTTERTEVHEVKYVPGFVKVLAWSGGAMWLLLLLYGVYKVIKLKTKLF